MSVCPVCQDLAFCEETADRVRIVSCGPCGGRYPIAEEQALSLAHWLERDRVRLQLVLRVLPRPIVESISPRALVFLGPARARRFYDDISTGSGRALAADRA
jgi:hypothetical protein